MSMKRNGKKLVSVALLMSMPPFVVLGDYSSNIGGIDLSVNYQPPGDITPQVCTKFEKDPQTGTGDLEQYKACQSGVAASKYMAELYAQGEGSFLGCVDGFSQGLTNGYDANSEPTAQMIDEARSIYNNVEMKSAKDRASSEANSKGQNVAEGEIIKRFRDVVNSNSLPSKAYSYPESSFGGYEGGFFSDNPSYAKAARDNGFSGFSNSEKGKVEGEILYNFGVKTYNPEALCKTDYFLFDKSYVRMNLWDYFRMKRQEDFSKYGWKDTDRVWNYFANDLKGHEVKFRYLNLTGKTMQEIQDDKTKPIEFEEVKDANGVPTGEKRAIKWEKKIATVEVPGRGADYYKSIFRQAFKESYDQYYLTQYFGKAFVAAHGKSREMGVLAGGTIGREVAKEYAKVLAYNAKYKLDSVATFNLQWKKNYDFQFNNIWDKFENHAQVELNSMKLIGAEEDGIFQAGELLSAEVTLTNLGRKSEAMSISLFGDLENASKQFTLVAPEHSSFAATTPNLAQIDKQIDPKETAQVGVQTKGAVDYVSSLTTQARKNLLINEVAEIDNASVAFNALTGNGEVSIRISNPSTRATTAFVTLRATLENLGTFESEGMPLNAKETSQKTIAIRGLDPLAIIRNGGIRGVVETVMNGRVLHRASIATNLGNIEKLKAISDYFAAVISDNNGNVNTGTDSNAGRTQELMSVIQNLTASDVKSKMSWGDDSRVFNTIVGQLGRTFLASKAAGTLNQRAQDRFNELGNLLDAQNDPGVFKRKDYRRRLAVFSTTVKVKKKNK